MDLTPEQRLDNILSVMAHHNFGMTEAARIIGSDALLLRLLAEGKIQEVGQSTSSSPNKKRKLNAAQVLMYARYSKNR